MKVLMSAYACESNKGSALHCWHGALEIARLEYEV